MKTPEHKITFRPDGVEERRVVVHTSEYVVMGLLGDNRTGKKIQQVSFTKRDGVITATKRIGKKMPVDADLLSMATEMLR